MTYPLSAIEGLSAYSASKLKSLGIRTTEALLEAARTVKGRKALATRTGITEQQLLEWAGNIYNAALGFSCFHVLAVNMILLPREIRPNWFIRIGLIIGGLFFTALTVIATMKLLGYVQVE